MKLSEKRSVFAIQNEKDDLILSGSITLRDSLIADLNGLFKNKEDKYLGAFYYTENDKGKSVRNVTDMDIEYSVLASALLDDTILSVKKDQIK